MMSDVMLVDAAHNTAAAERNIIVTQYLPENDVTSDASTSSTAIALLKHNLNQKFIMSVEVVKLLLAPTTKLSKVSKHED